MNAIPLDPTFATLAVAAAGAIAFWVGRITKGEGDARAAKADAAKAHASAGEAHRRLDELNKEFADYREHVARDYVSHAQMQHLESRITGLFQQLSNRLDKVLDR